MKKVCLFCGEEFEVFYPALSKKFCSVKCRDTNKIDRLNKKLYIVKTKCACGCGEVIMNPDNHYRYRKFIPSHRNAGGTHPRLGFKEPEEHVEMRMKGMYKHFENNETGIEKELYSYLDLKEVVYERQKQIGRTRPDAYIPELNLCVYADGEYWHSKPSVKTRDRRLTKTLISKGYNVLRLPSINNGYNLDMTELENMLGAIA